MADYPISNVPRRIVYTGSAGVGPYAFDFEVLLNTDINVYKNDVLLTITTDYTVSISPTLGTGSVTLVSAAAGTDRITIVGARAVERTTDFTTGGDFFANSMNDELDSQTILVQQVAETAERSIKAPVTDPTNINMTLPINTSRAGKTLAFDSNGNPVAGDPIGNWRGNWAAGVSYQNRDIIKDTTNDNVYLATVAHTSSGSLPISTNADSAKWALVVDAESASDSADAAAASATLANDWATKTSSAVAGGEFSAKYHAQAAATSATSAISAFDSFDDRYLGAKSSEPTLDNDGNALIVGALYFDSTDSAMKVYDGATWNIAYADSTGVLLSVNNLSDLSSAATARSNLGLGTIATQASNAVSITGGSISGITDLAIADGGTGASTAENARTNLGLGTMATQAASSVSITGGSITGGTITGITDLAVADGGTGSSTASGARTNLGLGTIATQNSNNVTITGGTITGVTVNASTVTTNRSTPSDSTCFIPFVQNDSTTAQTLFLSGEDLKFNASIGQLSAASYAGSWSGSPISITRGGTGATTRQAAMDALAGSVTLGQYLRGDGTDVVMSAIQASDIPTLNQDTTGTAGNVTGTVAVANGGTGQTSYTDGQLLIGNSTGNTLAKATLTAGTGVSITNGSGAITVENSAPMTYAGAGIAVSTGSAWGTSLTAPSGTIVGTSDTQTLTNKTLTDPAITGAILEDIYTISDGAAFEIDPSNGTIQLITLDASRTPKATNFANGESVTLMVLDGTAYTITWTDSTFGGSGVVWVGGTAPTLNTTKYTVIELWRVGGQVYGALVGDA